MPLALDGSLPDEQMMLLNAVREYARNELFARESAWDQDESSVAEILPELAELGLLGLSLSEAMEGSPCPFPLYAAMIHELSYVSPSVAVTLSVHNMVVKLLEKSAPEAFREAYLPHMGTAEHFSAFCLSEAGAGSDARATVTSATKVDGGYVLNGEKMWITNGMNARWFLTLARIKGLDERDSLTAFLVDGQSEGIERTKIRGKMGIRGSETAVISFHDCHIPEAYLLGEPGSGLGVFLGVLNEGRVGIAAQATGIAEACLDEMVSYAGQREQFGRPIGQFQAIADKIADSATEFEVSRLLTWRAATMLGSGRKQPGPPSMAKLHASETANRIAYRAVQVHGGTGYVNECRVERLYRDARVTTIYEGTSEVQRLIIARELRNGIPDA